MDRPCPSRFLCWLKRNRSKAQHVLNQLDMGPAKLQAVQTTDEHACVFECSQFGRRPYALGFFSSASAKPSSWHASNWPDYPGADMICSASMPLLSKTCFQTYTVCRAMPVACAISADFCPFAAGARREHAALTPDRVLFWHGHPRTKFSKYPVPDPADDCLGFLKV